MKEKQFKKGWFFLDLLGLKKKQLTLLEHRQIFMNDGACVAKRWCDVIWQSIFFLLCFFLLWFFFFVLICFVPHHLFSRITQQSVGEDSLEFKMCLDRSENAQHRHMPGVSCCSENKEFTEAYENKHMQCWLTDQSLIYQRTMICWRCPFSGFTWFSSSTNPPTNLFCLSKTQLSGQTFRKLLWHQLQEPWLWWGTQTHNQINIYEHPQLFQTKASRKPIFFLPIKCTRKSKKDDLSSPPDHDKFFDKKWVFCLCKLLFW